MTLQTRTLPTSAVVLVSTALFLLAPAIGMRVSTYQYLADETHLKTADAILILGASVQKLSLSRVLEARANAAIVLYQKHIAPKIVVSGYSDHLYDEVAAMHAYVLSSGVPEADIIVDGRGDDTFSSIDNAHRLYGFSSLIIPTQDFHIARALFLADAIGVKVQGFVVEGGKWFDYVREIPASFKALRDVFRI